MNSRILLPLFVLASGYTQADSSHYDGEGIKLDFLSEVETIAAGESFTVGMKIALDDGFHTYWQNPGIVGIPFTLEWTLPEGFQAGAIQWPTPEKVMMAVHPAHGYKRDVTLLVEITPPNDLASDSVEIACHANWMACAKTCHPGDAELTLSLPVAESAQVSADNEALFAKARKDFPEKRTGWTATGVLAPENDSVVLTLSGDDLPQSIEDYYFFSSNGLVSSDQKQTLARGADGQLTITMKKSEYAPEGLTELNGVLAVNDEGWSEEKQFSISAPLQILSKAE